MFTRLRRFAGVLLALALLPAASGSAQCTDHGEAGSVEVLASSQTAPHAAHAQHAVKSTSEVSTLASEPSAARSSAAQPSEADLPSPESTHVAADSCCPPAGMPGECSSAMGCSVMSATSEQRTPPLHVIDRAIVAGGVEHSPGPSRAPEVPPPRS